MQADSRELPDEVRRFILTSVPSVPYLEAMLLLRGDEARAWDATRLAQALYTRKRVAAGLLQELVEAGVAQPEGASAFAYRPATPELKMRLDELSEHYAKNLVEVADLIHSRTERRALQFADAFRWKKED